MAAWERPGSVGQDGVAAGEGKTRSMSRQVDEARHGSLPRTRPPPRDTARLRRAYLIVVALALAGLSSGLVWALSSNARPPRVVVMATGPEGSSYAAFGARYREVLARSGLDLRLRTTAGDGESLALLRDPSSGVAVALLQAGTTTARESPGLVSLGTMVRQPVWIFRRGEPQGRPFPGPRVSFDVRGSGTRALTTKMLRLLGLAASSSELLELPPQRAAEELQAGRIDGMALVAAWESPLVQRLLLDPEVTLVSFRRADAYVALEPTLEKLVLPEGVADLGRNLPPHDVTLLATRSSLVVRDDLHSAVQYLLLEAASEIHGSPGIFQRAGEFPAAQAIDVPLSAEARQFYKGGRPFLNRYLPYWMAVLVERLLIVLVPLVGIAIPLVRGAPGMYRVVFQRRLLRLYRELKSIERELDARPTGADNADLARRAARLEARALHLWLPLGVSPSLYTLKEHIHMVQGRLAGNGGGEAAT